MAAGEKTPHGGALAADLVPEHLLDGGEIILFAIKPSLWLVLFSSLRWLLFFGVVALLAHRIAPLFAFASGTLIIKAAVALAAARVGFAVLEWSSRLYVLTNRRVLRIKGIFHIDLFECSLLKIEARLVQTWYERLFGLGSILIVAGETGRVHASWLHVARPAEVHEQLRAAIRRARGAGGGD